jgi:hypothetical protein
LRQGDVEEVFHGIVALWALDKVCLGLAGAACGGLCRVNLVKNVTHWQDLVYEFGDEFLVGKAQFLECVVVQFPVHQIESLLTPLVMFLEVF